MEGGRGEGGGVKIKLNPVANEKQKKEGAKEVEGEAQTISTFRLSLITNAKQNLKPLEGFAFAR